MYVGLKLWKECGQRAGDGTVGVDGGGRRVVRERRGAFPPRKEAGEVGGNP